QAWNAAHGITPRPAGKRAGNAILAFLEVSRRLSDEQLEQAAEQAEHDDVPLDSLPELITQLEERMKQAAKNLAFEEAADLRDRIRHLRQKLVGNA
ncbi:MAG: UvrB/UvrC motif-containing protein, partial [Synechococcaceae cyanobacterium]|nr:UvrB/UvrC motif-containing protein [Synechococcaceae cyanobacterium]